MLLDNYKKQSPIVGVAGLGGGINSYIFLSSGGDYVISKSLRFDPGSSPSLTRTFSAGNRKIFTISLWAKKSKIGTTYEDLFTTSTGGQFRFIWEPGGNLELYSANESGVTFHIDTVAKFRDPSAWYHFVVSVDATNTSVKFYVNGVELTDFVVHTAVQNANTMVNTATLHTIGYNSSGQYFDGYLADYNFVDGQALVPTDFGKFDTSGVWQPKKYSGAYGTNGFHLDFKDTASIGNDAAGSNNWTANNIVVNSFDTLSNTTFVGTGSLTGLSAPGGYNLFAIDSNNVTSDPGDGALARFNFAALGLTAPATITFDSYQQGGGGWGVVSDKIYTDQGTVTSSFTYSGNTRSNTVQIPANATYFEIPGSYNAGNDYYYNGINNLVWAGTSYQYVSPTAIDSLLDSPSQDVADETDSGLGGQITGNYATLNPLDKQSTNGTLSNGNLDLKWPSASWAMFRSTMHVSSGRWYWEVTLGNNQYPLIGIIPTDYNMNTSNNYWMAQVPNAYSFYPYSGNTYDNTSSAAYATADQQAAGTTYGVALDLDAGTMTYYKNGVSLGVAFTGISGSFSPAASLYNASNNDSYNFGQRAFHTAAPSGFKCLTVENLTATIANGRKYFDVATDTGANILSAATGKTDNAGFVWIKDRANATNHILFNKINDAYLDGTPHMRSNTSDNETTCGTYSAPSGNSVGWVWDAGDSNTTIAAGGLNSSVYNQSSTWSNLVSTPNTLRSGSGAFAYGALSTIFDGNLANGVGTDAGNLTLNFTSGIITSNSTVEVYIYHTYSATITAGGSTYTTNTGASGTNEWVKVSGVSGTITQITVNGSGSVGTCGGIKIDGKILVDAGASPTNVPSIASEVRAQPTSGFSIVSYTGTGSAAEVAHGLNSAPDFIICKDRDSSSGWWATYISSQGATKGSYLNVGNQAFADFTFWNNTTPTSSVFSIGANANTNASGNDFIAYCFSNIEGYCKIGQHTNGASNNQAFIHTGFRPAWILGRPITADWWTIYDSKRDPDNQLTQKLWPNEQQAEGAQDGFDFLSNGFKCIAADNAFFASSANATWIYFAIAEHPFKSARAR